MLEHKIAQLEERLIAARVIDKKEISKDVVSVGSKVRLRDVAAKETVEYHIVGSAEANPLEQKLSNESPVGRAILGKKKGETVEVSTPRAKLSSTRSWRFAPPDGGADLARHSSSRCRCAERAQPVPRRLRASAVGLAHYARCRVRRFTRALGRSSC